MAAERTAPARSPLGEVARLFLRLGATSFGGPAAHIALMEEEIVARRAWLTREQFVDFLGAANLIPGPNSTEVAIHVGYARAGWPGLVVAGACFIAPAALMVAALAWAYVRFGALPAAVHLMHGVQPVVIAIVLQALVRLARSAVRGAPLAAVAVLAVLATALGADELVVLAAGGVAGAALAAGPRGARTASALAPAAPGALAAAAGAGALAAPVPFSLGLLFLTFLKIGSVLFGSGYVLLAFLRADFVQRLHWLSERQLLDAVAVGQVTPGPVFTTATFVGCLLGGAAGGALATLGIFLPAFVLVAASGPLVPRLRRSRLAGGALDGVNVASLALMAVVTWHLGRAALTGVGPIALATASAAILLRTRLNPVWLIAIGAVIGWLAGAIGVR